MLKKLIVCIALLFLWSVSLQAAFIVNSNDDVDDGNCDMTHCSLRESINEANSNAGDDDIHFDIPGAGPHTIQPLITLPSITDTVTIDGYSQPGASANTNGPESGSNAVLLIELDGSLVTGSIFAGLHFITSGSVVKGLVINRFCSAGVALQGVGNTAAGNFIGTDTSGTIDLGNGDCSSAGIIINGIDGNVIGGDTPAVRNIISGNRTGVFINHSALNVVQGNFIGTDVSGQAPLGNETAGVYVLGEPGTANQIGGVAPAERNIISDNVQGILFHGSSNNVVQGNYIGTDVTGSQPLGNNSGVRFINATNNMVGGVLSGAGNLISGNNIGVRQDCCGGENQVQGNLIGTDASGTVALGNIDGVLLANSPDGFIGGTEPGAGNVISGNEAMGLIISGSGATGHFVQGNLIGTDVTEVSALGNGFHGVFITADASDNTIGGAVSGAGNTVANNVTDGVHVESGTGNVILSNAIFANGGIGIGLNPGGVTLNDPSDPDTGANNLQNFPVLDSATTGSIEGTLNSTPNTEFTIQFFANDDCNASGFGEGESLIGSTSVFTDGAGNSDFKGMFPVPLGKMITATATGPAYNTSEFSFCDTQVETLVVAMDIHPTSCPNPLTVSDRGNGVVPVAILGSFELNAAQIDPTSVRLEGIAPLRSSLEDVSTPHEPFIGKTDSYDCNHFGPDGLTDLTLKFDRKELVQAIGVVNDGDVLVLQLTASLIDDTGILGEDVVIVISH